VKGAAVSEEEAQPLTGKAKRLANLKPFAKGWTSGSAASGEISATGRGPTRARVRQIGRPCAESSRLDDFDLDEQTFSRPAAPRRGVTIALTAALMPIHTHHSPRTSRIIAAGPWTSRSRV
jgi:hypothetical protein